MKQGPLNDQFDKMKESMREENSTFGIATQALKVLRSIVQELRDSGFDASLEVRPAGHKSPVPDVSDAIVNGTLSMEGMEIEFILQKEEYNSRQHFHAYVGNTRIENISYRPNDTQWLRSTVTRMMLGLKAKVDLLEEFNVGANGVTRGTKLDKSVLPKPPKLKAGP